MAQEKHRSSDKRHEGSKVTVKQEAARKEGSPAKAPRPEAASPPHPRMTLETETVVISEVKGEVLSDDDVPLVSLVWNAPAASCLQYISCPLEPI